MIATDGSQVRLPNSPDILEAFGSVSYTKTAGKHAGETGQHAYGRVSVAYDVLNRVAIDARIDGATAYEVTQTIAHLEHGQANDLWVHDRGYASYELIAHHHQRSNHFLIRCSKGSFATARKMLNGQGKDSQITTLHVPATKKAAFKKAGLPTSVKVRFVRVQLDTGEYEVLVTDLLDEQRYPTEDFAELYWQRWGVETFYSILKTRLNLENFTGLTAESVRQDFHSSVFLCGLESLTQDTQAQLDGKTVKHPQQVNRMVSFNAIKNHAFELLYSDTPVDEVIERLTLMMCATSPPIMKGIIEAGGAHQGRSKNGRKTPVLNMAL